MENNPIQQRRNETIMPGYILHLTAAQMFLKTQKGQEFLKNKQDKNDFLIGNLLPDTTKIKARSHFRYPKYHDRMIEYPETSWFIKKYKHLLSNSSVVGYLFHLYIDRKFFKEYMPRIVEFRNAQDEKEERRDMVKDVLLKRTGQRLSKQDFFSEKYYYGDYTKMNMYLVNRYQIPTTLDPNISNPGIKEVDYEDVKQVLKELKTYIMQCEKKQKSISQETWEYHAEQTDSSKTSLEVTTRSQKKSLKRLLEVYTNRGRVHEEKYAEKIKSPDIVKQSNQKN